jgi:ribosomal-protein-serine acetyltransferase
MIPITSATGFSILPAAIEHAGALASLVKDNIEHLRTYLPNVAELASTQDAEAHLEATGERAKKGEVYEWHLFSDATLCGAIRVKDIDHFDRKAQVGYFIGSHFQGKGIVTSSVRAVLAYCFESLDLNRVELRCAAANEQSMRVAERLGFTHEGLLRQDEFLNGVFVDQHVYSLLRDEFNYDAPTFGLQALSAR